ERVEFFGTAHSLEKRFNDAMQDIKIKTKEELHLLHDAVRLDVETKKESQDLQAKTEELDEALDNMGVIDKIQVKYRFGQYVDAMNEYYLNTDWQAANFRPAGEYEFHIPIFWPDIETRTIRESHRPKIEAYEASADREWGIPIIFPDLDKNQFTEAYKEKSAYFAKRMADRFDAKLNFLLDQPDTTLEVLKAFRKEIEEDYKRLATMDKKGGLIDLKDLLGMEQLANHGLDLLAVLNDSHTGMDMQMLEAMHIMTPNAFTDATGRAAENLIDGVLRDGNEADFFDMVNALRESRGEKPLDSFWRAKRYFKSEVATRAEAGVRETMELIQDFNNKLNGKRIEIYAGVSPEILQGMVYRERERLLDRTTIPESEPERLVVEFMSTTREGREAILKSNRRDELFKAIKNIQTHYDKAYKDEYADSMPDKIGDLRTNRRNLEKPTVHDRAARLQALIMLATEAEWVVKNLGTTKEFEGQNVLEALNSAEADKEAISPGLKFKDTRKAHAVPYKSALSRGGFNGADLAVKGLKVLAVFTVFANVANSIKAGTEDGEDFFDKVAKSVGNIVTNPAVLAGSAVAVGAHAYEMYPQIRNYPFASKYGKKGIMTSIWLERLGEKVGRNNLQAFTGDPSEWSAMNELEVGQIKSLMEKAEERNKDRPIITNEDMVNAGLGDHITSGLPDSPGTTHSRVRYLFYKKFLSGEEKPNINQLREMSIRS
ncbi:hypothetical protein KKA95_04040, partial [Patescibacteria group bacterium]|nr:hypothetical protein [Patescibacteria group bacterium]